MMIRNTLPPSRWPHYMQPAAATMGQEESAQRGEYQTRGFRGYIPPSARTSNPTNPSSSNRSDISPQIVHHCYDPTFTNEENFYNVYHSDSPNPQPRSQLAAGEFTVLSTDSSSSPVTPFRTMHSAHGTHSARSSRGVPRASQQTQASAVTLDEEAPSAKRRRIGQSSAGTSLSQSKKDVKVEQVDLLDVNDDSGLSEVLARQREATIREQQESAARPRRLADLMCVICMDTMTDITALKCGHLFCHKCVNEALIAGEQNQNHRGSKSGKCPICRQPITRSKGDKESGDMTVLEIKRGTKKQLKAPAKD